MNNMNNKNNKNGQNLAQPQNDEYFSDDKLYLKIISYYLECESVKETAEKMNVSVVKVRRVLITEGLWTSRAAAMVERLLNEGKNIDQIAEELCISREGVRQYLPYSRGLYMGENRSVAALNSEDYRKRIETVKEKVLRRKEGLSSYGLDAGSDSEEISTEAEPVEDIEQIELDNTIEPAIKEDKNMGKRSDPYEQSPGIVTLRELPEEKQEAMLKKLKMRGEDVYRLHLELICDSPLQELLKRYEGSREEFEDVLRKYGDVKYGKTISRDILVPGGLQLHSLHYVIQRLFGWQNSHLHEFTVYGDRMKALCDNSLMKFSDLIGIVFRSPWMDQEEEFWEDDYEDGSFKTWLRKKYTGAPVSLCHGESYFMCREDVEKHQGNDIKRGIEECLADTAEDDGTDTVSRRRSYIGGEFYEQEKLIAKAMKEEGEEAAYRLMSLKEMRYLGAGKHYAGSLLERLSVEEVFCFGDRKPIWYGAEGESSGYQIYADGDHLPESFDEFMDEDMLDEIESVKEGDDEPMNQPFINCITDELLYHYDFGDNWRVWITGSCGCEDLVEEGRITQEELDDAIIQVYTTYRPVVIAQDGISVFDDVGGPEGYAQFLKGINGEKVDAYDYDDGEETLEWAKSLGWSKRRSSNKNFL